MARRDTEMNLDTLDFRWVALRLLDHGWMRRICVRRGMIGWGTAGTSSEVGFARGCEPDPRVTLRGGEEGED